MNHEASTPATSGEALWSADPWSRFRAGYDPALLRVGAMATPIVTAAALGTNQLVEDVWWRKGTHSLVALGVLTALAALTPFETARRLARASSIPRFYAVQSLTQTMWLFTMVWGSTTVVGLIGVMLLLSAVVNDTRYFHDSAKLLAQYALALPLFLAGLTLLDALGGEGLWTSYARDAAGVKQFLVTWSAATCVALFVIKVVGGQWRALDAQGAANARLQRELDVRRAEQAAVQQASTLMEFGLSAGRFTHDVSSPLSTLNLCLHRLRRGVAGEAAEQTLDAMVEAVDRLSAQRAVLADAIRQRPQLAPRDAGALVAEAVDYARNTGARLIGREGFEVALSVAPATVSVADQHVGAIADLISNAARHSDDTIEISGMILDSGLYRVAVRDHGAEGEAQQRAVARVAAALSTAAPLPATSPEGLGIGLAIARLTALRFGGELAVAPAEGSGLVITMTLPIDNGTEAPVAA